jgi:oligopeptide transport system permease protein
MVGMLTFILRRLLVAIPTLLVLVTLAFFLLRLAPGGPFDGERDLPPEVQANIDARYRLDQPLPLQYLHYLSQVLRGDFGPSFQYRDLGVNELIAAGLPVSLKLGGSALLLALIVGVLAGSIAAANRQSWLDRALMGAAMTGLAVPNFVLAPLFVLLFAVTLGWLPAGGYGDGGPRHLLLPVLSLALPYVAAIARLTRASMVEVLGADYIRTARARGVSASGVLFGHTLRPALLPVVSYLGPAAAALLTGSVVVEQVYGLPGIGRYFVQGALNRDYTLVMGVVIVLGVLVLLFNLLVDVLYGLLDPRVRHD